jgi:hypothetical protein
MKIKLIGPLLLVLLLALPAGCALHQQTPAEDYLLARTQFNNLLESYLEHRETVDAETRQRLKENVEPMFGQAATVLDTWGMLIRRGESGFLQSREFLDLKNRIIDYLVMEANL